MKIQFNEWAHQGDTNSDKIEHISNLIGSVSR